MPVKRFNVILEGTALPGENLDSVVAGLGRLLKRDSDFAARLLCGQRTRIKSGVDEATGARYVDALQRVGAAVCLEPETLEIAEVVAGVEQLSPRSTPIESPIVASETATPIECPKCGAKNCKAASAVYKLFLQPEAGGQFAARSDKPADETQKGQPVSATERIRLYKAAAPPNSFRRTSVLIAGAMMIAPLSWFFGLHWFLLFAMLGIAAIAAYQQDAKRNVTERNRWKALVMCMQCGHVFAPNAANATGVQREEYFGRLRQVESEASARKWKAFAGVTIVVFAVLVVSSVIWPQRPRTDAMPAATSTAQYSGADSDTRTRCDREEKESSYDTQEKIKELAAIEETAGGVRYTIYANSWTVVQPRLDEFVHAIANTDACIEGKARRIDIYSPFGQVVGFADPSIGIRVLP